MINKIYLYGKNPLKEALLSVKREGRMPIEKLFLTKQAEEDGKIMSLVQSSKLSYEIITPQEIENLVGRGAVYQGICALLNEQMLYTSLDEVLIKIKNTSKNALFVLLDELQDPHNVGAIIRSAVAFGADAVLLPERNQTLINGTVIKASSGMTFAIPIVKIGNVNTIIKKLKDEGFWIYGLTGDGNTELNNAKFDSSTVIIIGGESDGIRLKTLELCDFKLSIKTNELCESLNASNATAIVLYEWKKQQG